MVIGVCFVTCRAALGVQQVDAIVNLDNVLNVRIKHSTATFVNHAVIIVPPGNVTRMETAHRAVCLTSMVQGVNSRALKTAVLTRQAAVVTSMELV